MNKTLIRYIQFVVGILAIIFIIYYLYKNQTAIKQLGGLGLSTITSIGLLHVIAILNQAIIGWYLLRSAGVKILFGQYYWVNGFSMLCNYLPLQASMIVRGGVLWTKYNIKAELFISVLAFSFLLSQAVFSLVGALAVFFAGLNTATFLILLLVALVSLVSILSPLHTLLFKLFKRNVMNSVYVRLKSMRVFVPAFVIILIGFVFLCIRYLILFQGLDYSVPFSKCVILGCASGLSTLIRLTPAGLGIREGLTGLIAYGIHFDITVSILIVILDRIISLIAIVPIGVLSWFKLKSS
jgi:uncharacterized membrane protein YbhN (UPF0104 family)